MEITGKIHRIGKTIEITDKFKKREFVLEYAENPTYPQHIIFALIQKNVDIADSYNVGDNVKVNFNLKGREATLKSGEVAVFNTLEVWRMEKDSSAPKSNSEPTAQAQAAVSTPVSSDNDDLPF